MRNSLTGVIGVNPSSAPSIELTIIAILTILKSEQMRQQTTAAKSLQLHVKKPFLCYIQDKFFQGNPISDGTLQIPVASIETITLEKIQ